jgi:hypothetical protein
MTEQEAEEFFLKKFTEKQTPELQGSAKAIADYGTKWSEGLWKRVMKRVMKMKRFADKESRDLQAEADAKATPMELWQAEYEEGVEECQRDALKGIDHRAEGELVLKLQADHPFWEGYIEGYEAAEEVDKQWLLNLKIPNERKQ